MPSRARRTVPPPANGATPHVRLHPHGLDLGERGILPLVCGAMHYWRHAPSEWGAALDAMKRIGFRLVDTYVPWGVHEKPDGELDFGTTDARLDVGRFIRLAHERDLRVVIRPGPHINAELTYFGIPERIVWDRACQARTPRQNPVVLPFVPVAFPVPSYASDAFHTEAARWLTAVARELAPYVWPAGPIVLLQVDNEGALYFRDGPYDQDYHPDSIALFRQFLREKYETPKELRAAWREPRAAFATIEPPHRFDARTADDLVRHLDWMEFHERLLSYALERMGRVLVDEGLGGIPTTHNFPLGESATPLNAARVATSIDLVGLDYYHRATPSEHMTVLRRTTELASRCEGRMAPAFGAEVGTGFPPFMPPMDENDSLYTLMAAFAYGLRGYSAYMAVERDRWVGAPIDPHGRERPFAAKLATLHAALDRTQFHTLRRRAPVRLVVPRSLRRLARATHAFGPVTPALFNVLGAGFSESCLEEDFGTGDIATLSGEMYLRTFERALAVRGVPFAYAGGETLDESITGASWVVVATAGGLKPELFESLRAVAKNGLVVTIGPRVPDRDGSMRLLETPLDVDGLELETLDDVARAGALVARRIDQLSLPTYPIDPSDAHVCVHEDAGGKARIAFVMNPTPHAVIARVALPSEGEIEDVLDGARIARTRGAFEIPIDGRTVGMFTLS